jgi:hypothetical protein
MGGNRFAGFLCCLLSLTFVSTVVFYAESIDKRIGLYLNTVIRPD